MILFFFAKQFEMQFTMQSKFFLKRKSLQKECNYFIFSLETNKNLDIFKIYFTVV